MSNWVFVETYHNWQQDKEHNFKYLGLREKTLQSRDLKKKDLIFIYISKFKKFSDIRVIEDINLIDIPNTFNYDKKFEKCIKTSSVKELKTEKWIELELLKNELSFLKSESLLGFLFIRAPFIIDETDSNILLNEFNKNN
tara:strand:- start:121 stop:540 length:420 start_codon:yes stop_codon:yes gene_type:complete